jgi:hypothetical protein
MDWLSEGIVPVAQTAVWGLVVYLLGNRALVKFQDTINRTLDRLKKAGPAEFESLPQVSQVESKIDPAARTVAALPAAPVESLLGHFEARIRENLPTTGDQQEREAKLVRNLAVAQIAWIFEALNFLIFGSQLALLQAVNTTPLTIDQARVFYKQAAASHAEFYASYPFESWLDWLQTTAKFVVRENDTIFISDEGREFLKF